MKRIIIIPLLLIIGCSHIQKEEYDLSDYPPKYANIVNNAISELIKFQPTKDTPLAEINYGIKDFDEEPIYGLSWDPGKALIKLKNGDWIYIIIVSSWHYDEDGGAPDLTLAIDNKGVLWRNNAHVCGGISFTSDNKKYPKSSEDFFSRYSYRLGKKNIKWEKINKSHN